MRDISGVIQAAGALLLAVSAGWSSTLCEAAGSESSSDFDSGEPSNILADELLARRVQTFVGPYVSALIRAVYPNVRLSPLESHMMPYLEGSVVYKCRSKATKFYRRVALTALKKIVTQQDPLKNLSNINYDTIQNENNLIADVVGWHLRLWNRMDYFFYATSLRRPINVNGNNNYVMFGIFGWVDDNMYCVLLTVADITRHALKTPLGAMLRDMGGPRMWIYSRPRDLAKINAEKWESRQVFCDPPRARVENASPNKYASLAAWWQEAGLRDALRLRPNPTGAATLTLHAIAHFRGELAIRQRYELYQSCITVYNATWTDSGVDPPDGVELFQY